MITKASLSRVRENNEKKRTEVILVEFSLEDVHGEEKWK